MKVINFLILLILFVTSNLFGQLKEFVVESEKAPQAIPVFMNYPKAAAIIIYSSITNLSFTSNTGGITNQLGNSNEGKYTLIVEPEKQFLSVKSPGFKETRIKIEGLSPKDVRYFTIEEKVADRKKEKGTLIINTIPQGAQFIVDGFPISGTTPQTLEMLSENYSLIISKTGYLSKEIEVNIQPGKTVSKTVELEMDLDLVSEVNYIATIQTTGDFILDAKVEISGENLVINYNLNGKQSEEYEVGLKLKRFNSDFELEPTLVTGDIGDEVLPGNGKKIVWQSSKEYSGGFDINEYYLEISAEEISSSTWYYWVGSALAAGGAAAYYVLFMAPTEETSTIATPPARPGN